MRILIFFLLFITTSTFAQLPDSCKLRIGTNLAGIFDFGTEIPFVDLMKAGREWGTKSIGDPNDPFNSGFANDLEYREDGYPTHIPQVVNGSQYQQEVFTIWGIISGWPVGTYTVLYEGVGELRLWGTLENVNMTGPGRITFDVTAPEDGIIALYIERSEITDPIRNIRVLMPGTENTYEEEPFYDLWLDAVDVFDVVRFMDWGSTNNWGEPEGQLSDSTGVDWSERSQMDRYTWAYNKGVPYEMMVKYMNDYDKDGWICVPHSANEDYVRNMARYFRDNLDTDRHLYVEYSNEIWNWLFDQTRWVNAYGVEARGEIWPEGTVRYVQRTLDWFTEEFAGQMDRITRVVGVQTGWQDVAERVVRNVDVNSFDAITPTYYFGLSDEADERLDQLGANATVEDLVREVRTHMPVAFGHIRGIHNLGQELNKPLAFYEGGQHITPHPFGVPSTYDHVLLDVMRDTAMYNLYNEWFDLLRTIQVGSEPLVLMNFSFVTGRSAQFGSWGVLETMDQDTSLVPAPKYRSVIENMDRGCRMTTSDVNVPFSADYSIQPNPTTGAFNIRGLEEPARLLMFHSNGALIQDRMVGPGASVRVDHLPAGNYMVQLWNEKQLVYSEQVVLK